MKDRPLGATELPANSPAQSTGTLKKRKRDSSMTGQRVIIQCAQSIMKF
jgi:hypothetical protein